MTKWKLDHFTDLCHLLAAATNIIVTNIVHFLFVLTFHWITFAVDDSVGGHDTVRSGIGLNDLELNGMHCRSDEEQVTLLDRTVGLQEVGFEVDIKEVSRNTFNRIIERKDMNSLPIWNIPTRGDCDDITQTDTKILTNHLVHPDLRVIACFICKNNTDCVPSLLSLDQNGVATKQLQLLHLGGRQTNDGVVIVGCVVDNQPIRTSLLSAKYGILHISIFAFS
mmetsp:Transcript_4607/g.6397  ORF Transcript_4607/g.6397 Transcript_4607/m.6397 type:complete len:223 (+) Transcript_4607:1885-2553(+)